jgi:hypothetical protein
MFSSLLVIIASLTFFPFQITNFFSPSSVLESAAACQQPAFTGSRVTKTQPGVNDTTVADFNSDGRPDIAGYQFQQQMISIQFNLGNGLFGEPKLINPGAGGISLTNGDFNNDGFTDFISPTKIMFGDGQGNFSEPRAVQLGTAVDRLITGDFNGDDNLDFASVVSSTNSMMVFYGDGFGNFPTSTEIPVGGSPDNYEVNDFNNDRIDDLAVVLSNVNRVVIALGTENGAFQSPVTIQVAGTGSLRHITSGDLNGDGKADLVTSNDGFGTQSFFVPMLNDGSGNFTALPRFTDDFDTVTRLKLADTNFDGKLDLIFTSTYTGTVVIKNGNNDGTFQTSRHTAGLPGDFKIFYEDFTGDGIPDFGLTSYQVEAFAVLINDGSGNFGAERFDIGDYSPIGIVSADFNGDGRKDFVVAKESLSLSVTLRNAGGGFDAPVSIPLTRTPRFILTGDMNADNKPDIIALVQNISEQLGTTAVFISNGNGTFQPPVLSTIADIRGMRQPALTFMTNDSVPDLIVPSPANQRVVLLQGYTGGVFIQTNVLNIQSAIRTVATGDFNQDGKYDIAVLNGSVMIYLGDGNGNHEFIGSFPSGSANLGLFTSDFNNDGILDLVTSLDSTSPGAGNAGKIFILMGAGKGGFGAPREYTLGRGPTAMGAADFDGDGNVDLAVANPGQYALSGGFYPDSRISVLYGDGQGVFPRQNAVIAASSPRGLIIEDFSGDGLPDIMTSDYVLNSLSIIKNTCLAQPANLPALSFAGNASVTEGDAGESAVNVTVNLSSASTVPVTVNYKTAPQNSLSSQRPEEMMRIQGGKDYRTASGTLRFAPGETSKNIQVFVRGDLIDEFDEKFQVYLTNANDASIADNNAEITIVDNDAPPTLTIGNVGLAEGNSGNTAFNVPVTLSAASEKPVNAQFLTGGGTAVANQDYIPGQGTLTINAGQIAGSISVAVIGDLTVEQDETFLVEISDAVNATINGNRGTATIINDDQGGNIQFSSATYSYVEGSNTGIAVTVTRAGAIGGGVSVRFRTQAGTATPGQDYTEVSTVVNFAANETAKSVVVPIMFDQLDEADETVNLILDNPVNATLGSPATAVLTIIDAENLPNLTVSNGSLIEGDTLPANLMIYVRLSQPSQQAVTVNYSTADGTATAGIDYQAVSGTFTIPRGVTRKALIIPIYGDFFFEPDETILINFSNAVNAVLTNNQSTATIVNDEITSGSSLNLASVNFTNNGSGSNDSYLPSVNADGKVVAFESFATNLVNLPDGNNSKDVFVRFPQTRETRMVSITQAGTSAGNCASSHPIVSGNGRYVAFNSCASNLNSDSTAIATDSVYVRDLETNQTRIASVHSNGDAANGEIQAISNDGRYVVFQSADLNMTSVPDPHLYVDVFVRDMQANVTQAVSVNSNGSSMANQPSGNSGGLQDNVAITPDGRFVLFMSTATNIVNFPQAFTVNLYVRDLQTQTTKAATVDSTNSILVGNDPNGSISDDGRYVVFAANINNLVPGDTNNAPDVFRRDMQTNTTELVSANNAGNAPGNGWSPAAKISGSGRYVAFMSSSSNLGNIPDTNEVYDAYRRDMQTNTTVLVSVNSSGTNAGNNLSTVLGISTDGNTILMRSAASNLTATPFDNNSTYDLFLRDLSGNYTRTASANEGGTSTGNQESSIGTLSRNGNAVAFQTASSNLVPIDNANNGSDIYLYYKALPRLPQTDFDGDGKTDLSVFRPSNRAWYINNSRDASTREEIFGFATDILTASDYDGDGKTDIAIFRDGLWYVSNSATNTLSVISLGQSGDKPVPGDYDGDNRADAAVFRPSNGGWYIRESSDGNVRHQLFGLSTDVPAQSDFDGDRRTDIAVIRDGVWYVFQSATFTTRIEQFGLAGDKPVAQDFDGDGKSELAVFRPSNGAWYYKRTTDGTVFAAQFGISTDIPVKGDFDGDGKADLAVFREGVWYIWKSSDNDYRIEQFGTVNDVPVPQ